MGAIPSIRGVHVEAGPFLSGTDFVLLGSPSKGTGPAHRASVLFGRNGSGKTTIARAIASVASGEQNGSYLFGDDGKPIGLSANEKKRIRVFDEDYVRAKIHIERDGVESIVMLGTQADAKRRIDEIEAELTELGEKFIALHAIREKAEKGPSSLSVLETAAKEAAKRGGWADRSAEVEGKRQSLTQQRWERILGSETEEERRSLQQQYDSALGELRKASVGHEITDRVPVIDAARYDETRLLDLLSKELDEPVLSDREKRIMALIQDGHQELVEQASRVFSKSETTFCPMCQQAVSAEHKASLEESILKILNDAVDVFKDELAAACFEKIEEDASALKGIPDDILIKYRNAVRSANSIIARYRELTDARLKALFTPRKYEALGLGKAIETVNSAAAEANDYIDSINRAIADRSKLLQSIRETSDRIAWVDAKDEIARLLKTKSELTRATQEFEEAKIKAAALNDERQSEEAKIRQTQIAAKAINTFLTNIYFDSTRFVLEPKGSVYKIRSHGIPVLPQDISTGERNALGLCYFFSEGGKGKFEGSEDDDPQYIVLDDPVSSFDMENEIGICSLLRERFAHILEANDESAITVMTHSASVASAMRRVFGDISHSLKGTKLSFKVDNLELRRDGTRQHAAERGEYPTLLRRAYDFALSDQEDRSESYVIGNELRRILEGYSSFNYGMGMAELSRDDDLKVRFGEAGGVLSNIMYRLALDDESHLRERLTSLNPPMAFERFSYAEKQTMAQCVLVILSCLDEDHVVKLLAGAGVPRDDARAHLASWKKVFVAGTPG